MNKRKDIIIIIDMMSAESADVTLGRKNPINSCCTKKQKCLQSEIQEGVEQVATSYSGTSILDKFGQALFSEVVLYQEAIGSCWSCWR